MNIRHILSLLAIIVIYFSLFTVQPGCAGMTPPTGGPRDSLPPVILQSVPKDSTTKFTGKKILLTFNEFVQLQELQKNLLVNPTPKINPTIESKLKTISITIRDTLEENVTYSFDFGNAIQDYNEGNPIRNYRYVFSTGSSLDSLELAGRVLIAETGKPDSTLIVILHRNLDDSAVVKATPRYVARVDSSGFFQFGNLAPGTFALYALKDEGGQRRYLSKDQLFGFYDSAVTSQSQKKDLLLYAFTVKDTAKAAVSTISTSKSKKKNDASDRILKIQMNITGESMDLLSPLEMVFIDPLEYFDSSKVILTDEAFKPLSNYHFKMDTSNKKVSIINPWTENTAYNLILDTTFAQDTLDRKLVKMDTISFRTKKEAEYGLVRLRFINLQLSKHPVLQFVQGDDVKYSYTFTNNQFYAKLFQPGDYDLRLVFDDNRNGIWDTGQFFGKHIQPEKVRLISRRVTVKPNWDNEIDIQL
jgi:uncharacterized protein (DUF2141 family)